MHEPKLQGKSYVISKQLVWDAWLKVEENGGAAGPDGVTVEQFEANVRDRLYVLDSDGQCTARIVLGAGAWQA
ncbi:hypothetical protein [Frankia sp. CiP3]|uniref:hypothetical protein n=1 Tax=Frankia sp. CiP3 TaxID=2880971 RepID=UPI001EF4AF0B|nr:hypothetical protein [Frankia sp. CiP3]